VAAEFANPVMLYSIGKDSSVMLHLAMKAFYPAKPPFPLLHVDTTWKFREMIKFRDETAKRLGLKLLVHVNEDGVKRGINPFDSGSALHTQVINKGESIRVFPLSNWTELDIWQYIMAEGIPIVPLYFAKKRPVVERDGTLIMVDDDRMKLRQGEKVENRLVRFRTLGCYPLTGAIESDADNLEGIVTEMFTARTSERQGRLIDTDEKSSMEKKKKEGYF
jgi:sulfate adenylyltransferase subunit 2